MTIENASFSAGQGRAATMLLEQQAGLPVGLLQSIVENKTGWRMGQPVLPAHRQSEEDMMDRQNALAQASLRFQEKMGEFDGITPLAIDAYYRGDRATRESLQTGNFPQDAINNIFKTLYRQEKFGGESITEDNHQMLAEMIGSPTGDVRKGLNAPAPMPSISASVKAYSTPEYSTTTPLSSNVSLVRLPNGRYKTGNAFFDMVLSIESNGNTRAVSPTGAKGLFQFTRTTGRAYGLITKDGRDLRFDPQANLNAMIRLTQDNAKALRAKGVEPTPLNLYLAHNQGAGGAAILIKAAQTGRPVPAWLRKNMNHNGGRGETPAQFIARFARKVNEGLRKAGVPSGVAIDTPSNDGATSFGAVPDNSAMSSDGSVQAINNGQLETVAPSSTDTPTTPSGGAGGNTTAPSSGIDTKGLVESVFGLREDSIFRAPPLIRQALKGLLAGI